MEAMRLGGSGSNIPADASKCRFCGEWVKPQPTPGTELAPGA